MSDHTQDCLDAFYSDGGQSGCICGADERAERDTAALQAALERIAPPAEAATPPLDVERVLLSILTVCGDEGDDPTDPALAFQMIRKQVDDALVATHRQEERHG